MFRNEGRLRKVSILSYYLFFCEIKNIGFFYVNEEIDILRYNLINYTYFLPKLFSFLINFNSSIYFSWDNSLIICIIIHY